MNEISQNTLGVMPAQPKKEPGIASRVQGVRAAEVSIAERTKAAEANTASKQHETAEVGGKQLEEMVDDLNGLAQAVQRQLQFSIDDENGKMYVKVIDAETQAVIREIPSEEIRNMQKQLKEVSDALFQNSEGTSLLFQGEA